MEPRRVPLLLISGPIGVGKSSVGCEISSQLRARWGTLAARVRKREIGAGLDWHLRRSQELSEVLLGNAPMDFAVRTDGQTVAAIAAEIISQVDWETT